MLGERGKWYDEEVVVEGLGGGSGDGEVETKMK